MPTVPIADLKKLTKTKALKVLEDTEAHFEMQGDMRTTSAAMSVLRRHFNVFVYKVDEKTKAQLAIISPRR